jgi:predicted transcriptional regulator
MNEPTMPLKLTSAVVSAYVAHNPVQAGELATLIRAVYFEISMLSSGEPELCPSVPLTASVTNDYLVCLEDGKRLKTLNRYLRGRYGMTPEEYRAKWRLPSDYPMTAPNYAARRSSLAKQFGLGRPVRRAAPNDVRLYPGHLRLAKSSPLWTAQISTFESGIPPPNMDRKSGSDP